MQVKFSTQPAKKLFKDLKNYQLFVRQSEYEQDPSYISVYIKMNNNKINNTIQIDTGAYQRTVEKNTEVLVVWVDEMTLDFGD